MIGGLWKQFKNWRDEKQFAEYQARDEKFGAPTQATLNDRAEFAARKGHWKTAFAAIDAGADVNMPVDRTIGGELRMEYKQSLAFLAVEQNNADALGKLLDRGANQSFVGGLTISGRWARKVSYSILEFAVLEGKKDCVSLLLERGGNLQSALNGALEISARQKSYMDMTGALLKAGAADFETAQRSAEVNGNDAAIPLIKGAAKKAFEAAQAEKPAEAAPTPPPEPPSAKGNSLNL